MRPLQRPISLVNDNANCFHDELDTSERFQAKNNPDALGNKGPYSSH